MFGTVQDLSREISKTNEFLAEVLSMLKELLQIFKKESKSPYVS